MATREKCIGTVGAKNHHIVFRVFYRWLDDFFFFFSDQSFVSCMGVQPKYGDFWLVDTKIPGQAFLHDVQLGENVIACNKLCHFTYRYMFGNEAYPEIA